MGLLDDIMAGQTGASPWGALYQPQGPSPEDLAKKQAAELEQAIMAQSGGGMPTTPSISSVFGAVPQSPPQPQGFGAGAAPFSFAGPGSNVMPAGGAMSTQPAPQQPAPPIAPAAPLAAPQVAPPAVASDQADPIAVGKYQMPRVGAADDFEPEDAPAAPAARGGAPAPGAPGAAPQTAPFSLGGVADSASDRLMKGTKGFLGNLGQGPIGALAGGLGALITGKSTDPGSIAAEHANLTARALQAKGVDPATIQAAIYNPEIMKTLIAQNFGPDKFQHVTIKNADGSESPQAFDPSTGKYSGAAPQAPNKFSVDPGLTGKDRLDALKAVDPLYARKIESLVNGDLPMPTGVAALRPESKRMIEDALAVDGSTSASDFQTRANTRKDYASGVASRVTKSINTTIGHFATLDQAVDKLGNYSYFPKIFNTAHDIYSSNLDPNYQKAKSTFEANKEAAVKELDFALSGGHSSVSGSAELRDKFNRSDSPEALHAAITEAMSLLQKRLESHTKGFTEGTKSQRDPQDFIYPENRQAFSKMLGQDGGAASGDPAKTIGTSPTTVRGPGTYVWTGGTDVQGAK